MKRPISHMQKSFFFCIKQIAPFETKVYEYTASEATT